MKMITRFLILVIDIAVFYIFYKTYGDVNLQQKVILGGIVIIILLSKLLSFFKYFLWSVFLVSGIGLILYGNKLVQNSECTSIGCNINAYALIAPVILGTITILLLLIQLIQFIVKRSKAKTMSMDTKTTNIFR